MTSLKDPPKLGPWQKVTPTNAAGDANSDSAPTVTAPTAADKTTAALRADIDIQILVELRVIARLLSLGLNVNDDVEAIRSDESARLGI